MSNLKEGIPWSLPLLPDDDYWEDVVAKVQLTRQQVGINKVSSRHVLGIHKGMCTHIDQWRVQQASDLELAL